jgi:hypothetical protein
VIRRATGVGLLVLLGCGGDSGSSAVPTPVQSAASPAAGGSAYFPAAAVWYADISRAPLDRDSAAVVAYLDRVGWGTGRMQIDFSIEVLEAAADAPLLAFEPTQDHFLPDCDLDPVPVPAGGSIEGEAGYECRGDGDCHLIVVDRGRCKLFEMWRADIRGSRFRGGCLAVWDMGRVYPPSGRGEQCTSADAAGYPIAPLLFSADEVAAGSIDHAIRFILPNARIRKGEYLHPATHGTRATTGPPEAPPYGARLRLRADFAMDRLPNAAARVVARGMQKHGILLADGGNIALTARSDRSTRAKWNGLLGSRDLEAIRPADFEMVNGGERIPLTLGCVRNP